MTGIILLVVLGCSKDEGTDQFIEPPVEGTFYIGWIAQNPQLTLPISLQDPATGWPEVGDDITWEAKIINKTFDEILDASYTWILDDINIAEGIIDLPSGTTTIELPLKWSNESKMITLELEGIKGEEVISDKLTIQSDALSLGLAVDEATYDWMDEQKTAPPFELFMRAEIEQWNKILRIGGAIDRIRLQNVEIVPTNADYPMRNWLSHDFVWYFYEGSSDERFLSKGNYGDQTIVLHELLHQRGIIDLYDYDVEHEIDELPTGFDAFSLSHVGILDRHSNLVVGTDALPFQFGTSIFNYHQLGRFLMSSNYTYATNIHPHTAYGLNLYAGMRTTRTLDEWGNGINEMSENHPYLTDIPESLMITVKDVAGEIIPNAVVEVYMDWSPHTYVELYYPTPDFRTATNIHGQVSVPKIVFNPDYAAHYEDSTIVTGKAAVAIVRVSPNYLDWDYHFLPILDLNMEYINGNQETVELELTADIQ